MGMLLSCFPNEPVPYIQLAYLASMLLLAAVCWGCGWTFWLLLIPTLVFLPTVVYGSHAIDSGMHLRVICKGEGRNNQIAITFDDGPHLEVTPAILQVLREQGVKATFFNIGKHIQQHPELVRQIAAEGHIIGNHTFEHGFFFDLKGAEAMQQELARCNQLVAQLTGQTPRYFRPPYGVTNPNVAQAVKRSGMVPVGWSLRSLDTVIKNPEKLLQRVIGQVKPGDIVLFHDTQAGTVSVLKEFLQYCNAQGYQVVPLNELINVPPYE